MSFQGRIHLTGTSEYLNILKVTLTLDQSVDTNLRPNAQPRGGTISLTVEASRSNELIEWMVTPDMTKSGYISFTRREMESAMNNIQFNDAFCINYTMNFNADNANPMTIDFTLSARVLDFGGGLIIRNRWPGEYNDAANDTAATTISNDEPMVTTISEPEEIKSVSDPEVESIPEGLEEIPDTPDVEQEIKDGIDKAKELKQEVKDKVKEVKEEIKNELDEYIPGSKDAWDAADAEIKAAKEKAKEELEKYMPDMKNFGGDDGDSEIPNPSDFF